MDEVTIQIDSKWVKIVRSPLYWIVAALSRLGMDRRAVMLRRHSPRRVFLYAAW